MPAKSKIMRPESKKMELSILLFYAKMKTLFYSEQEDEYEEHVSDY